MKIYTNDQIRAIEAATIRAGVSSAELIDRAGKGVADEVSARWSPDKRIVVFAGPDRNGAQALAATRYLLQYGYGAEVYLFNIGGNRLSADCRGERDRLLDGQIVRLSFLEVLKNFERPQLGRNDLVIDGLWGSDLNAPLTPGGYVYVIQLINDSKAEVVSIDLPSGMYGDWNADAINRNIIHATLTLAIQFPRLPFFLADNEVLTGSWKTIDIGLDRDEMRRQKAGFFLVEQSDIRPLLKTRPEFCSKADFGSTVIYAGSYGMMGAALLSTRAASRSGVGKVTAHTPRCGFLIMQTAVPSALFESDSDDHVITDFTLRRKYDSVAIGPGIGTAQPTIDALEQFLKVANANRRSLVLDADALNCIAQRPTMLNFIPQMSILTPHSMEFDRMFGEHSSEQARWRKALQMAEHLQTFIVLKGRYTAIIRPDGKVYINSSGTPALATAGSGDVLTGLIAGMQAQGYSAEIAALLGCFIHGVAGHICADRHGIQGTTAEDIADSLGEAIKIIME